VGLGEYYEESVLWCVDGVAWRVGDVAMFSCCGLLHDGCGVVWCVGGVVMFWYCELLHDATICRIVCDVVMLWCLLRCGVVL
jgi:hypothetical protein